MRYQKDIEVAMDSKPPKRLPASIIEAMNKAVQQVDDVTKKIRAVVSSPARGWRLNGHCAAINTTTGQGDDSRLCASLQ
jgi:hypothetical protein